MVCPKCGHVNQVSKKFDQDLPCSLCGFVMTIPGQPMDWKMLAVSTGSVIAASLILTGPIGFAGAGVLVYSVYKYEKELDNNQKRMSRWR